MAAADEDNKQQRLDEDCVDGSVPTDVLEMRILPQLPIKYLLRFKSACKPWRALISENLHRYRLPGATYGLFFRSSISISSSASNKKLFYLDTWNKLELGYVIDPTLSSLLPPHKFLNILDCCNGLLLCRFFTADNRHIVLCVCNPLTGRMAVIPELPHTPWTSVFLSFDPRFFSHYQVICVNGAESNVFSSETGKWAIGRGLRECVYLYDLSVTSGSRVILNGMLYLASDKSPFLAAFDRNGEFIHTVYLPHLAFLSSRTHLGHSGGRLQCALRVDDKISLWVLDDDDADLWTLKHTVSVVDILPGYCQSGDSDYPHIMRFHPDLDVVFVRVEDKLFSYDLCSAELTEICTCGVMKGQTVFAYSPFYSEDVDL